MIQHVCISISYNNLTRCITAVHLNWVEPFVLTFTLYQTSFAQFTSEWISWFKISLVYVLLCFGTACPFNPLTVWKLTVCRSSSVSFLNFLLIGRKLQTEGVSKHQDCSLSLSSTKTEKAKTELSEMKPCLKRSSCLSIHCCNGEDRKDGK